MEIPAKVSPFPHEEESVWDYPRPPRLEPVPDRLAVICDGTVVAETRAGFRVLETSHPPVYYFPPGDVPSRYLSAAPGSSICEYKGAAAYWTVIVNGNRYEQAAWSYPNPTREFAALKDHLAFYASRVDACWVGDELVTPQAGDFYGGWITSWIVGPFKGPPGTGGW